MAKVDVSPELGHRLREFRLRSGIRANELANYIGKTPAYITKLEKGDFKSVDEKALEQIVNYITSDPNGYERFIDDFLSSASDDEIKAQLEIMRFDMIERTIPIPPDLIVYINEQLSKLGMTAAELVEYINQNDDYDDDFFERNHLKRTALRYNCFYPLPGGASDNDGLKTLILYRMSRRQIEDILSNRTTSCPHFMLFSMVYSLLKLQNGGRQPESEQWRLKSETSRILQENKFYTILDRSRFFATTALPEDYKDFLNNYDIRNFQLTNDIFEKIEYLSNCNVIYTNEKLEEIVKNLNEDTSFALGYMALPIHKLSSLPVAQKREFLEMIREQIDDYLRNTHVESAVELY